MATYTPNVDLGIVGGFTKVYADSKCTQPLTVFDAATGLIPQTQGVAVSSGGIPAPFQTAATTVYFKHDNGINISMTSAGVYALLSAQGVALGGPSSLNLTPFGV